MSFIEISKPANVMIDSGGSLKLIDFNLTRDTGRETMVAGTPAYMPPDFWLRLVAPIVLWIVTG